MSQTYAKAAKLPEYQFLFYLIERFQKPLSEFYEDMDPYTRIFLYINWMQQKEDKFKRDRDMAIFLGSFSNPEAAQKIIKRDKPDIASSEEDFEASTKMVREKILQDMEREKSENPNRKRRKRRQVMEGPPGGNR